MSFPSRPVVVAAGSDCGHYGAWVVNATTASRVLGVVWGDKLERGIIAMQDNFALVFEIDGDVGADNRLDLAQAPVRFEPMAHDGADFEECVRHGRDVTDPSK